LTFWLEDVKSIHFWKLYHCKVLPTNLEINHVFQTEHKMHRFLVQNTALSC
jgi:hypothetical protein